MQLCAYYRHFFFFNLVFVTCTLETSCHSRSFIQLRISVVSFNQITLMDANYVMDETLGTSSFDISKLTVGQTQTESFLIGKVRNENFMIPVNFH